MRHAGVLVVFGKVGYYVGNIGNASTQRRVHMTRRLLEITSVTAHTEYGPAGERRGVELPFEAAAVHRGGNLIEIAVHAQLPVESPILEHATFQPGRSLTVSCALPRYSLPAPETPILCLYQHKEWWMRPTWVSCFADVPERTQMLVWKATRTCRGERREQWHVLLAVSEGECRADIRGCEEAAAGAQLAVDVSTNRIGQTSLDGLALLYARGDDPYALIEQCVSSAVRRLPVCTACLRRFPEALRGFGWCTWDALGQDVSESGIFAKMDEFKEKQVPVSWVLIDDGWSQTRDNKLTGLGADSIRFPQGLAHTIDVLKQDYGVRYVGVWQAFQGYWGGVDPDSDEFRRCRYMFETLPGGMSVPSAQPPWDACEDDEYPPSSGGQRFWWHWDDELASSGVDFVKVDSQSTMSVLTRGTQSYGTLLERHHAVDLAASAFFKDTLINCMGMAPEDYWRRPYSPITRTSDDFFPRVPESLPEHAIENAYCSLLMGCLYHCDWDMFWTRHPNARAHAWLRWFSGGPVYCSDALGETDPETLRPFLDENGDLTHPDNVGVPVVDSLLADPMHSAVPLGIRNTFHGDEVVMFLGLNAGERQIARLHAKESVGTVRDLETGETTWLDEGQTMETELSYGEYAVFAINRKVAK